MNNQEIINSLADKGTFALLVVLTQDGEVILRPIGGKWDSGIINAIQEMNEKYPNCKMKLFEQNYDDWFRYFKNVVNKEQLI
ncbi:hypothetical protein ACAG39_02060 [Caldicellulosiruptoraceae bacterium PP1]